VTSDAPHEMWGSEVASRACVASGHPVAAQAGIDALAVGGSAVDAALACAFTQWVVNAPLCGPGGDLLLLHAHRSGVTVYGGWSRVPLGLDPRAELTASGPRAAVVPGAVRGAEAAWVGAGSLVWSELLQPALAAASGHRVTAFMARSFAEVARRGHGQAIERIFGSAGPPVEGDTLRSDPLADTLACLAGGGPDALHHGDLAARIDQAARDEGAWLRADDLDTVSATVEPAVRVDLGDVVLDLPGWPSQAVITVDLLAAAGAEPDPASAAFAEAVASLTERRLVERCVVGLGGTTVSVTADGDGNSAAVVVSLAGTQFGSGWVAGDTGIAFGNRVGTALSTRPDLPAANPRPGAVLPHTLSAAFARADGRTLTAATPGGDRQVQWLAQAVQRFRLGRDTDDIASGPRWFVCPEGDRFGVPAGIGKPWFAFAEADIEWAGQDVCAGYEVRQVESVGGGLQVIVGRDGGWMAASDPRSGGQALALEETSCTSD
jgi:gamma-glutamyltranspeptidase / glutathione hydrolase